MELLLVWVFFAFAGAILLKTFTRAGSGPAPARLLRPIGAVMIVAGFAFAISSVGDFFNGIASSRWPATEARLTHTQVIHDTPWWSGVLSQRRRYRGERVYRLNVGYEYFVNGEKYRSNAISFGTEFDSAVHQRQRFEYAKPLLTHYDPADPRRAVLDPGITLGSTGALLLGGIVMLLGARMIFVTRASHLASPPGRPGRRMMQHLPLR